MSGPRIVFMGTPEFAVPVLAALADRYEVAAVYTRADKPAGRGKALAESPVKVLARARALAIEQPRTLRSEEAQARLRAYRPDLIVVAAYGLILPQAVLDIPPRGCLNTHASLLPRWRGASPITFAILAGDTETGVTLMQMDAGLDTGPLVAARRIPIAPTDTTGTLTERLSRLGAELLIDTVPQWLEGQLTPSPQKEAEATTTRLVRKEDGNIDWNKPAEEIERAVRAYNPWPSAYTYWRLPAQPPRVSEERVMLKVWRAEVGEGTAAAPPGTVVPVNHGCGVATGAGLLVLREVQLAGKRALPVEEFVRGQRGFVGARLGE